MNAYLGRLRRYGAWALIAGGLWLALDYAFAWNRGRGRANWLAAQKFAPGDLHRSYHALNQVSQLASKGDRRQAERQLDDLRWRSDFLPHERDEAFAVGARLRIQFDGAPESELLCYLSPDVHEYVWSRTVNELDELRRLRGDSAGRLALWESIVDGRIRHPVQDRTPFPYGAKWASEELASIYLEAGDGPKAHFWARRWKYEFDADWNSVCGAPIMAEGERMEDLLERSAERAGRTYERVPREDTWRQRSRRIYGPPWYECVPACAVGLEFLFFGLSLLRPAVRRNPPPGPIGWRRRGNLARLHLACYLGGLMAAMLSFVPEAVAGGGMLTGESLMIFSFLSIVYCALLAPFLGCFIAEPAADKSSEGSCHFEGRAA